MTTAKALLAGGCFWDLQSAFKNKSGIISKGKLLASQHRSTIFYFDDTQKQLAKEKITELQTQNQYTFPIITEIKKATIFYPASPHHQTPQPGIHRPQLLS